VKHQKAFDCVQMKAEIQERLLHEIAELGEEEAARRRHERLAGDPALRGFLDRIEADYGVTPKAIKPV
jgi:hypothetical protein